MSKAIITANYGDTSYRVRWQHNTRYAEQQKNALAQRLIDFVQQILDAELKVANIQAEADAVAVKINAAIVAAQGSPDPETTTPLVRELAEINARKATAAADAARLKMQRAGAARLKTSIENAIARDNSNSQFTVWCSDFTDDLPVGAEVNIVLVPAERSGATLNIYPAYESFPSGKAGKAADFSLSEGWLVSAYSMTPEACFWNWAMLPGWQRWRPTFRHATITAIDKIAHTCDLDLDAARSSVRRYFGGLARTQGLNVNRDNSAPMRLSSVPIRYMMCDSAAFEVNDTVIVKFTDQDWTNPVVRGFKGQPKPCPGELFLVGTIGGDTYVFTRANDGAWSAVQRDVEFGGANWYDSSAGGYLSWKGATIPELANPQDRRPRAVAPASGVYGRELYYKGEYLCEFDAAVGLVLGAARRSDNVLFVAIWTPASTIRILRRPFSALAKGSPATDYVFLNGEYTMPYPDAGPCNDFGFRFARDVTGGRLAMYGADFAVANSQVYSFELIANIVDDDNATFSKVDHGEAAFIYATGQLGSGPDLLHVDYDASGNVRKAFAIVITPFSGGAYEVILSMPGLSSTVAVIDSDGTTAEASVLQFDLRTTALVLATQMRREVSSVLTYTEARLWDADGTAVLKASRSDGLELTNAERIYTAALVSDQAGNVLSAFGGLSGDQTAQAVTGLSSSFVAPTGAI